MVGAVGGVAVASSASASASTMSPMIESLYGHGIDMNPPPRPLLVLVEAVSLLSTPAAIFIVIAVHFLIGGR